MAGHLAGPVVSARKDFVARIKVKLSSLRQTTLRENAVRFFFGGACTVMAGLVAKRFGPEIGGLFLAFPAIFPAGASLIESHEKKRKAEHGIDGTVRGRATASVDSAGASIGCIGLIGFAFVLWKGIPGHSPFAVISAATLCWMLISVIGWKVRKSSIFRSRRRG